MPVEAAEEVVRARTYMQYLCLQVFIFTPPSFPFLLTEINFVFYFFIFFHINLL